MSRAPFVSYAQNGEDVVLHRALGALPAGRYLEIGANDPTIDSISRAFYDRGWAGITVEPVDHLSEAHRATRPRDTQLRAVAGRPGVDSVVLHEIPGTGLSTTVDEVRDRHEQAGFDTNDVAVSSLTVDEILRSWQPAGEDLHFVVIDTEGSEAEVLAGFDLRRWRPWVLVVEATAPNSSEPTHERWEAQVLDSGYEFCLFDGLSRFYVATEHAADLKTLLSAPANPLDGYVHHRTLDAERLVEALTHEVVRWRAAALTRWAEAATRRPVDDAESRRVIAALRKELELTHQTVSWRVTSPLRTARRLLP